MRHTLFPRLRNGVPAFACGLILLSGTIASAAPKPLRPLSDFLFTGYLQGRFTGLLSSNETNAGPLNDLPDPDLAGGEASTQALIKRLEFSLGTALPWPGWSVLASAGVTGSQTQVLDAYLAYQPASVFTVKAGRFRVPFGIDPQTSSAESDFVERPLIYGFGNFGWIAPLGMDFVGQRDYGLRADYLGPVGFAGFASSAAAAWVLGNGRDVESKSPTQIMARLGTASRTALADMRHDLAIGLSISYGRNEFIRHSECYLPIGAFGNLAANPDAVTADDLGADGTVTVLGADAVLRMNQLVLKAETLARQTGPYASRGYYITALYELAVAGRPLTFAFRWDEAVQGYADGVHRAGQVYRAAATGINWDPAPSWRLQADYFALLLDEDGHAFPGSDLLIAQVQFSF